FVVASGRTRGIIPRPLLDNPRIRFLLTCNGSVIWDQEENRAIEEKLLPYDDAVAILRKAREYHCIREVSVDGMMYISECDVEEETDLIFPKMRGRMHTLRTAVPDVEDFCVQKHMDPEKLLFFFRSTEAREPLRRWVEENFDLAITSSHPLGIEINTRGVSKGEALEKIAAKLGIARENVFAVGDSENDGEMIAFAGTGVAMGNAEDAVLQLTDLVTADNEHDGAAQAMIRWILEEEP
ncbi:MAG: HAD-IIB family hydrolase, partial [Oscillospiraceae bacterium]|nr:HAD-IIB family hydrolase [Oscillospiraceae bacterium]